MRVLFPVPATTPAFLRPIIAMKRPIPAVMPYFKLLGISFTSFSLKFVNDRRIKIIPSTSTAVRAIFQGFSTPEAARLGTTV